MGTEVGQEGIINVCVPTVTTILEGAVGNLGQGLGVVPQAVL